MTCLVVAVIILHAVSLPVAVCAAAEANADEGLDVTLGLCYIPLFRKTVGIEKIKSALYGRQEEGEEREARSRKKKKAGKFGLRFVKSLFAAVYVRALDVSARIGLSDAAATAIAVGGLRVALFNACRVLGYRRNTVDITADYGGERLEGHFVGIISLCIADIIYAAIAAAVSGNRRRGARTAKQRG